MLVYVVFKPLLKGIKLLNQGFDLGELEPRDVINSSKICINI